MITLKVADIIVEDRHRRDMGNIPELAASIVEHGLLHPVVVTPDGRLIAGERRLLAFRHLGREDVPVTVIDIERLVEGEYAENTFRKDFMPSEIVSIRRALEPIERELAKQRQRGQGNSLKGQALDKIAHVVGRDRKTIMKATAIVEAAEAEPERFGKLQADMDRSGRVNGPYQRLCNMRQAAAIRSEPPPYPNRGPYRVAVADVPWPYDPGNDDPSDRATHPYPTMSIEQIIAEADKVRAIMHADSILWFWANNFHLVRGTATEIVRAWGFEPKTMLTWEKHRFGRGHWLHDQTEHCLVAVRGKPTVELKNQTTLLRAPRGAHSEKPDAFFDLVESLCPSSASRYCYMFARAFERERWDCHGDEAPRQDIAASVADVIEQIPAVRRELDEYDAARDLDRSLQWAYRRIRDRVARGGRGWGGYGP
jgi:N6-adenosine-specific RNA methylase IME4